MNGSADIVFAVSTKQEMILGMKKFKVSFNAPVVLSFVILCFAAWILNIITNGWTNDHIFSVYRSSLLSPLTYVRFFGHAIGHANWDHYLGNMMILLIVGPLLEEKYGSKNILIVMVTTAFVTGVMSFLLFPNVQLLGASGIVFAFILLSSFTSMKEGNIPLTFILVAVIYLGEQVYQGLFIDDGVSNFGHILGGICGSVLGYYLNRDKIKMIVPAAGFNQQYPNQYTGQNLNQYPGTNANQYGQSTAQQYNQQSPYTDNDSNKYTYY